MKKIENQSTNVMATDRKYEWSDTYNGYVYSSDDSTYAASEASTGAASHINLVAHANTIYKRAKVISPG